jgi:hypothetical protein
MEANFRGKDPVPALLSDLTDALELLQRCRERQVPVHDLLNYIECLMDQIEATRLYGLYPYAS